MHSVVPLGGQITEMVLAVLLAALRLAPTLAFAPPFTLIKMPAPARVTMIVALAAALPNLRGTPIPQTLADGLIPAAFGELGLGIAMALGLQWAFALVAMAGRALDIQAGFGLAFLIDPTTKAQMPLIGAIFNYATAAVFFTTNAPYDLLLTLAASFQRVPVGQATAPKNIGNLLEYLGTMSVLSLGLIGLAVTVLFLIDLVIAMMSRTLPQMNVLVLGFQVKSFVTILLLPITLGLSGAALVRILRLATEAMLTIG